MHSIEVNGLYKQFGEVKAVNDISFKVEPGELFGFLGVNGAGKSTTINILCTLLKPTAGEIKVDGLILGKEDQDIRRKIGVVFQGNTLDDTLTIKQNLYIRAYLYENNARKVREKVNKVCETLEIGELLDRSYKELSGGQKRRCEIARALLNEPRILFLDEPTTGLDPHTRKVVWEQIEALRKEKGMTVFLTTHYMEEAVKAKHIAVMEKGKIVAFNTPYELKERYTTDQLKVTAAKKDIILPIIKEQKLKYYEKENRINIEIPSSLYAVELLNKLQSYITSFEVVQGTMDDAFLNITGRCLGEE